MDNNCMKTNYHNNWNLVRQYTHEQRELNMARQEKLINKTNINTNKKRWTNLKKKRLNNKFKPEDLIIND